MPEVWTADRVELLKRLWSDGLPASEIGATMACFSHTPDGGRNAVLGKVHRLGLSERPARGNEGRPKTPRKAPTPRPKAQRKRVRYSPESKRMVVVVEAATTEPLRLAATPSRRIELADVLRFECLYPDAEGDPSKGIAHTFCGCAAAPNLPYCDAHARIAYPAYGTPHSERELRRIQGVRVARERARDSRVAA